MCPEPTGLEAVRFPGRPPELARRSPRQLDRRCERSRRAQEGKCSATADDLEAKCAPLHGRAARAWPEARGVRGYPSRPSAASSSRPPFYEFSTKKGLPQRSRLRKPFPTSRKPNVYGSPATWPRSRRGLDANACRRLCQSNSIPLLTLATPFLTSMRILPHLPPNCEIRFLGRREPVPQASSNLLDAMGKKLPPLASR